MRIKTANRRARINAFAYYSKGKRYRRRNARESKKDDIQQYKYWSQYKKPGVVYHSCTLHPCYVSELDIEGGSIYGISLLDGSEGHGCSLGNCGVYMMKEDEIQLYKDAWAADGERGLLTVYYGGGPEAEKAADEFIKTWRS